MSRQRGLGKGLGALIPSGGVRVATGEGIPSAGRGDDNAGITVDRPHVVDQPGSVRAESADPVRTGGASHEFGLEYAEIDVSTVLANPKQPRKAFDEDGIVELANSVREIGLLQPIVVRAAGTGHELIAGERRLRAFRLLDKPRIPALVRRTDDDAMLRDALLENLHRAQLNPLEEAAAYEQLLTDFTCTQDELASRIGRSRPQISNTLRLLKLPAVVQTRVAAGVLSAGHARALLSFSDPATMEDVAKRIVAEGLSVRSVEELALLDSQEGDDPVRRKRHRRKVPVEYLEAADQLGEMLETRVRIDATAKKGRIVVEFSGVDDLSRILDVVRSDPQV